MRSAAALLSKINPSSNKPRLKAPPGPDGSAPGNTYRHAAPGRGRAVRTAHTVRSRCAARSPRPRLTATVTATAAATGYQRRPATAHNARTMRTNWEYARPEKRTVEDQTAMPGL